MKLTEEHKILLTKCESAEHLNKWFKYFLGVSLGEQVVSRFATSCPLDVAWEIYENAISDTSVEPLNLLAVASRASQKTLLMASIELAIMFHDRRDILHFAGSKDQLGPAWDYFKGFLARPVIRDFLDDLPSKSKATLNVPTLENPDDVKKVSARCLSITPMTVQGAHSSAVVVDELLTLKHEKRNAYQQIGGIPTQSLEGKPYFRTEISSRRGAYSVVEENIANSAKTGLKVKAWTILELTKRCPDSRSGIIPTVFYADPFKAIVINEEEFNSLNIEERSTYHRAEAFDKCLSGCALASQCMGDLKKQKSTAPFLNNVEHVIATFKQSDISEWISQRMSLKPSSEGLIFSKFAVERHVKNSKDMLELFLGKTVNYTPNHTQLITEMLTNGGIAYAGIDHSGGTAEAAIVVGIFDSKQRLFMVDCAAKPGMEMEELISTLMKFNQLYKFKSLFPDPAAADKNKILRQKGFKVVDTLRKEVMASIEIMRSQIMTADGTIKMYFLQDKTFGLQLDMMRYHFTESGTGGFSDYPAEEYSHFPDSCRYLVQNLVEHRGKFMVADFSEKEKDEIQQQENRAMNPAEALKKSFEDKIREKLSDGGVEDLNKPFDGVDGFRFII